MVTEVDGTPDILAAESVASPEVVVEATLAPAVPESVEVPVAPAPPTSPPTPPVTPAIPPAIQQYIARLEQQNQVAQQQTDAKVVEDVAAQYAQQLAQAAAAELGLTVEQLLPFTGRIAKQQAAFLYEQYNSSRIRQAQIEAAFDIGKQYNVDPRTLMSLPSPDAMIAVAKQGIADKRVAELEAQVAKLTKAAVPAQNFAQGAQPGTGAGLTGDALQSAWLKHEREHPDRPNPYTNAYRVMVNS